MRQFVLLNGPPRCGKDTLARGLVPYIRFKHFKFAGPMKSALAALLEVTPTWIEDNKETKIPEFNARTVRQLLIDMSESYLKEEYGEDILGKIAWLRTKRSPASLFISSDTGFRSEAERVISNAGKKNCIVIRIHRPGCTFDGDSRSYLPDGLARTFDLHNNVSREQFLMYGLRIITREFPDVRLLREPEWIKL